MLTTCWMGWNRSGLVNALALVNLGVSPDKSIRLVRNARGPRALGNQSFVRAIHAHA
jgi:protein-tyrosine phosphatase